MAARPDTRVLELGCGRGVAARLVTDSLTSGRYLGLDRSATAVRAATTLCAEAVAAARAQFVRAPITDLDPPVHGVFDVAFAVNVNGFWVGPASAELAALARVVVPGGRLLLVYEAPPGAGAGRIRQPLLAHLDAAGWSPELLQADGLTVVEGTPPR